MNLTLIGFRGSGKTSVAAPLAQQLKWTWIDADTELERRAGRTIREIFAAEGEAFFRQLEHDLLAELLSEDRHVIATGGGAILNAETRRRMRASGPVIWLRASLETIGKRITTDPTTADRRPNLTPVGGRAEIAELLQQREPLYRDCATLSIDTDDLALDEIVRQILDCDSVRALME